MPNPIHNAEKIKFLYVVFLFVIYVCSGESIVKGNATKQESMILSKY